MTSIFPVGVENFRLGIEALNKITPDGAERFPLLLSRILGKIHEPGASIFSAKEEEQLCEVLGLGADGVKLVVQLSAFIFESAAQNNLKAAALMAALADTGLSEKNVSEVQFVLPARTCDL
jgi:COMM domain containing 10